MTIIFDGRKFAQEKEERLKLQLKKLGRLPKLVAILVGENPASKIYLRQKAAAAKRVGIKFEEKDFPANIKPEAIVNFIHKLNIDPAVDGIMVQLPLPKKLEIENWKLKILGSVDPKKDVDGLTGKSKFLPATVKAIMAIIENCKLPCVAKGYAGGTKIENLSKAKVCVVGAGQLVGKPLAVHLKKLGADVTVCDEYTKDISQYTKQADILVSATGVPNLIKKEMVKSGAVVIDVGSPVGDVDPSAALRASFFTPVPGGVGPVTVVCLLENLIATKLFS